MNRSVRASITSFALKVAELGSFRKAAKVRNVAQPTLSAGVKQLEQLLGSRIFQRDTRNVSLTEFGRHILPSIKDVAASKDVLDAQVNNFLKPAVKLVRIGVSPIVEMSKLVSILSDYRTRNADVEVVFKECFVGELDDRLREGTIDLAVWPRSVPDTATMEVTTLYSEPWVFVPNASSATARDQSPVSVRRIAGQSLILTSGYCGLSQATQSMFDQMGIELTLYPGRAISYSAIEEWSDLGLGAGLLPASKVSHRRQGACVPVLDPDGKAALLDVVACWFTNTEKARHVEQLFAELKAS